MHPFFAAIIVDAVDNSPELYRSSSPVPQIMTFVPQPLLLFCFLSITRASCNIPPVRLMTRSSVKRSSQGTPELNSHEEASSRD